jgi:hypothetical protein
MTVFEQQNLADLRGNGYVNGYVQITNAESAKTLMKFIEANFNHQFPYGLKLIVGVGFYCTDNYIIHCIPEIVKIFKTDTQGHLEFHQTQLQKLVTALDTLR